MALYEDAWIDSETSWQPEALRPGRALFWLATLIAAMMVVFVTADVLISWAQGAPTVRIVALIAAVAVWLIGCICRALLP